MLNSKLHMTTLILNSPISSWHSLYYLTVHSVLNNFSQLQRHHLLVRQIFCTYNLHSKLSIPSFLPVKIPESSYGSYAKLSSPLTSPERITRMTVPLLKGITCYTAINFDKEEKVLANSRASLLGKTSN